MVRPMKRRYSCRGVLLLAVGLAGGCSSSQMSRIDRNRDIYETWPIDTRQAVLDGKVEPGMNPDMVRVAWGEPSEVSISPAGDEIWVYSKGGDPGSVYYPPGTAGSTGMGGSGKMADIEANILPAAKATLDDVVWWANATMAARA